MPGKPGMLRGADNIAALCTRSQAMSGKPLPLSSNSAAQPDHIPAPAFISWGSSFSFQPVSKSQCSPSGSWWPGWLCKVLEEGAAAKASGHQVLQGSGAGVAWKDGWIQAVVQKLVEKPGGTWKSSSWPAKGDKEKLDPCLNIQGSCFFRPARPGA